MSKSFRILRSSAECLGFLLQVLHPGTVFARIIASNFNGWKSDWRRPANFEKFNLEVGCKFWDHFSTLGTCERYSKERVVREQKRAGNSMSMNLNCFMKSTCAKHFHFRVRKFCHKAIDATFVWLYETRMLSVVDVHTLLCCYVLLLPSLNLRTFLFKDWEKHVKRN